jgi:hypothetical protein
LSLGAERSKDGLGNMNKYLIGIANLVFVAHLSFGVWLLLGWQFESWRTLYLLSLILWILSWVVLRVCPLTYLEFTLRNKAGEAIDSNEEFIHYYLKRFFGVTVPMPAIYWGGVVAFCAMTVLAYTQ